MAETLKIRRSPFLQNVFCLTYATRGSQNRMQLFPQNRAVWGPIKRRVCLKPTTNLYRKRPRKAHFVKRHSIFPAAGKTGEKNREKTRGIINSRRGPFVYDITIVRYVGTRGDPFCPPRTVSVSCQWISCSGFRFG